MKPETRFRQSVVLPFLKKLKYSMFFPIQQLSIRGDPDLIGCCRGQFVALELKATTGSLRKLQQHKLSLVTEAGGISIVTTPENWDSVKRQLLELNKGE